MVVTKGLDRRLAVSGGSGQQETETDRPAGPADGDLEPNRHGSADKPTGRGRTRVAPPLAHPAGKRVLRSAAGAIEYDSNPYCLAYLCCAPTRPSERNASHPYLLRVGHWRGFLKMSPSALSILIRLADHC